MTRVYQAWCVVDPDGDPIIESMSALSGNDAWEKLLEAFNEGKYSFSPTAFKTKTPLLAMGYGIREVRIDVLDNAGET